MKSGVVRVPLERLSDAALTGIVDDFVLREGTDYGVSESTLDDKRRQVLKQLRRGEAVVVFDPGSETCTVVLAREFDPTPNTE